MINHSRNDHKFKRTRERQRREGRRGAKGAWAKYHADFAPNDIQSEFVRVAHYIQIKRFCHLNALSFVWIVCLIACEIYRIVAKCICRQLHISIGSINLVQKRKKNELLKKKIRKSVGQTGFCMTRAVWPRSLIFGWKKKHFFRIFEFFCRIWSPNPVQYRSRSFGKFTPC